jgi:FkbM family methyltransferase
MKKSSILTVLSIILNIVLIVFLTVQYNSANKSFFSSSDIMDVNARYDHEAFEVIKSLKPNANCVDIGAHKGTFTEVFLEYCPKGSHFAVEPLPYLYEELVDKFGDEVTVFPQALSNEKGSTIFNYVVTNPGYSGLKKRDINREDEVKEIEVELELLDNLIPESVDIDFMKIDIEGAEFLALQGA